jgi:hypothetical protein
MSAIFKYFLIFLGILTLLFSAILGFETHRSTPIGWVLLVLGVLGTAAGAIYLGGALVRQSIRLDRRDISLWLLLPGVMLVGLGSPLEFQFLLATLPRTDFLQICGVIISIFGMVMVVFSGSISRLMPHYDREELTGVPSSAPTQHQAMRFTTGLWLAMFGIALGYSSLIGLAGCLLFLLPGSILRGRLSKG